MIINSFKENVYDVSGAIGQYFIHAIIQMNKNPIFEYIIIRRTITSILQNLQISKLNCL